MVKVWSLTVILRWWNSWRLVGLCGGAHQASPWWCCVQWILIVRVPLTGASSSLLDVAEDDYRFFQCFWLRLVITTSLVLSSPWLKKITNLNGTDSDFSHEWLRLQYQYSRDYRLTIAILVILHFYSVSDSILHNAEKQLRSSTSPKALRWAVLLDTQIRGRECPLQSMLIDWVLVYYTNNANVYSAKTT